MDDSGCCCYYLSLLYCSVDDVKKGREWVTVDDPQHRFTKVIAELGRKCSEWPEGATNYAIESLIEECRRPGDVVLFTDDSVVRGIKSGWSFSAMVIRQ